MLILNESGEWLLLGVVSLIAVVKDHPLQYLRMKYELFKGVGEVNKYIITVDLN